MLIRFTVENFMSFRDRSELSMVPGLMRLHKDHIIQSGKSNGINILRGGVIYGANASGKSNFVKALAFAQNLILEGVKARRRIPVRQFKLEKDFSTKPSFFQFEFMTKSGAFNYGFELTNNSIISEWLYSITKSSQKILFERTTQNDSSSFVFGINFKNKEEKNFLEFTGKQTRMNQLFLTESIDRNIHHFEEVHNWFTDSLTIIYPQSRYGTLEKSVYTRDEICIDLVNYLDVFDTGIKNIDFKEVDFSKINIPNSVKEKFLLDIEELVEENHFGTIIGPSEERFIFTKTDNEIIFSKMVIEHKRKDSNYAITLDLDEESDGTKRLFDLIPVLISSNNSNKVFIIDELDRSLHPSLCYKLYEIFFEGKNKNSQLISTTHESCLLNLDLFRRDEIWFVEKNNEGSTEIYSLEEFSPRYDKNIRKGYLQGRFGALPIFGNLKDLGWK